MHYGFVHLDAVVIHVLFFSYSITRDEGTFGGVIVYYELFFTATNQKAYDGGDFLDAENLSERFEKGERTKYILITPRVDNQPEQEKTYTIRLMRVEGLESITLDYSALTHH